MRIIFFVLASVLLLSSCEDSMFLKSQKKMKSDIQGTWERSFLGATPYFKCGIDSFFYKEQWVFEEDKLYTTYVTTSLMNCDFGALDSSYITGSYKATDLIDTTQYIKFKIDAGISRVFLKLELLDRGLNDSTVFVDKWEFVTLDHGVLYIATDDPKGNSVLQREFFKIK